MEHAKGRYRVLYALLAGTGLRIGEALAVWINDEEGTSIASDCKTLYVRKSIWNGADRKSVQKGTQRKGFYARNECF
jgi:hypothetical protein